MSDIQESPHGGINYREMEQLQIDPNSILDFSTNVLPVGLPVEAQRLISELKLDRYPDRESLQLRRVLADHWQMSDNRLIIGNGSCELIHSIASLYLSRNDVALIEAPAFSEYARSSQLMNASVVSVHPLSYQRDDYLRVWNNEISSHRPRIVWICNPNNPTGRYVPSEWILDLTNQWPEVLFVVDEAYMDFVRDGSSLLSNSSSVLPDNLFVLRSLTKFHALAGVRLGYLVAHNTQIEMLSARRVPWTVNVFAQKLGEYVVKNPEYYASALEELRTESVALRDDLRSMGFVVEPSDVCFFLMQVSNATEFRRELLKKNVLVRDCLSFGLPNKVRISPRFRADNERLYEAIRQGQS